LLDQRRIPRRLLLHIARDPRRFLEELQAFAHLPPVPNGLAQRVIGQAKIEKSIGIDRRIALDGGERGPYFICMLLPTPT
jgi:hypothetical protein